jgi:hypothetical protein
LKLMGGGREVCEPYVEAFDFWVEIGD